MSDLISRKKLKAIIEPMVGIFEDDGSFWWSRDRVLSVINSELVEADEPMQEELTKMAWCEGFDAGFAEAQETISNYIKRMGFAVEIPKAHELYVRLKGEKDE